MQKQSSPLTDVGRATMKKLCAPWVSSLATVSFLLLIPGGGCVRIIGGKEVVPHSRPYMVLLKLNSKAICAGALLAKDWVLTAAHCKVGKSSRVILGAHSTKEDEKGIQILSIKEALPYPCYDQHTHEGDLQLLKLKKNATLNKSVSTLALPKRWDDVKPGTRCQVAGWGRESNKPPPSSVPRTLKEVAITVIDRRVCNDEKHYNYAPVIGLNMICAGNLKGGQDSCNGDSGSPLICEGIFRGVTSFGLKGKCGVPQGPGIYTFLSKKHYEWISKTMKGTT